MDAHQGAAQVAGAYSQLASVHGDDFPGHAETDTVAGNRLIHAFAALQNRVDHPGIDAVPVILDADLEPVTRSGLAFAAHAHPDLTRTVLVSIVEQIAERLGQVRFVTVKGRGWIEIPADVHLFVAVHLVQRPQQALQHRLQRHRTRPASRDPTPLPAVTDAR